MCDVDVRCRSKYRAVKERVYMVVIEHQQCRTINYIFAFTATRGTRTLAMSYSPSTLKIEAILVKSVSPESPLHPLAKNAPRPRSGSPGTDSAACGPSRLTTAAICAQM